MMKMSMKTLVEQMPERIRFETVENKKNGYQDIQEIFAQAAEQIESVQPLEEQESVSYYMEALSLCAPLIHKEVFDHYKNLEIQYKHILHRVCSYIDAFEPECQARIERSIRTACENRMILAEKYWSLAESRLER